MSRFHKILWSLSAALMFLAASLFPSRAMAQGIDTALLRGTVTDSSGAVVPNATVTMINVATGISEKRPTDESGRYLFTDLKPATYTAKVEVTGFKTLIRENVALRVGQQTDLDFKLEVGEVSQQVEVSAEAPQLNTVSGALGTEVTGQYMINMPLYGRDYSPLVFFGSRHD